MKRPASSDEIAWLASLLVNISGRLNEKLGLNRVDDTQRGTGWSYVEVQGGMRSVYGPMETLKVVFYSLLSWIMWLVEAGVRFMRTNGLRVVEVSTSKLESMVMLNVILLVLLSRW
ncbi:hypothetical protein Sango_1746300 [Sesamum angolense]|uniref:Uncharacterized protein n=1 Tax=Sesamum angolense TaxID=2727404 RepID=A0AAE1WM18_9LAMI|nr:hypothetical protein Sango_1746300 [Sesamum angolense]